MGIINKGLIEEKLKQKHNKFNYRTKVLYFKVITTIKLLRGVNE